MLHEQVAKRIKRFVVEGGGEFPFDMLRYDNAWPATEQDSGLMPGYEKRRVTLFTITERLTVKRWESFNWTVVEDLHHRHGA
jgi:hypothetical protein